MATVWEHSINGVPFLGDNLQEPLGRIDYGYLLDDDPTLEPRDVLVMCPDVETYAPLIGAAFGLGEHGTDADGVDTHPAGLGTMSGEADIASADAGRARANDGRPMRLACNGSSGRGQSPTRNWYSITPME